MLVFIETILFSRKISIFRCIQWRYVLYSMIPCGEEERESNCFDSSTIYAIIMHKISNKQIQNVKQSSFTRKISTNLNVQTNSDLPIDKSRRGLFSDTVECVLLIWGCGVLFQYCSSPIFFTLPV